MPHTGPISLAVRRCATCPLLVAPTAPCIAWVPYRARLDPWRPLGTQSTLAPPSAPMAPAAPVACNSRQPRGFHFLPKGQPGQLDAQINLRSPQGGPPSHPFAPLGSPIYLRTPSARGTPREPPRMRRAIHARGSLASVNLKTLARLALGGFLRLHAFFHAGGNGW